ncbi:nuclear transport factor 2 family protein [Massilia arenosa]|uniref:Nuclear transport factor 2 family protein n=1 Tax=Zemynaea arenosa TaxID=2561931 RepID=A0A4Y9RRR8_9BURK|nr:nuclear transport factor 2 family protein [Massilia arenosa]TFW10655.1 nuclear transport factor 2 family protein [Massilia arenosa]
MNEQANIDLVRQCYDAFIKRDMPRLLSYMDQDIDWQLPEVEGVPFSGHRYGRDEVASFFKQLSDLQDVQDFRPIDYIAQNDKVAVMGHYGWTVKASGQRFDSDWMHVFTVRNGKVIRFCEYGDTHKAALAYGAGTMLGRQQTTQPQRPPIH